MVDYEKLPSKHILCIDIKSFYASCAAVMAGLDPLESLVAVIGDKDREGSIVLAASPRIKKEYGIKTGSRVFEIPNDKRIKLVEHKWQLIYVYLRKLLGFSSLCSKGSNPCL